MSMQKIKQLFNNQRYADCAQACLDLTKKTEDKAEPCLYYIKSLLKLFTYPVERDNIDAIASMKKVGEGSCKTLKEFYAFKSRVHREVDEWKIEHLEIALSHLKNDPKFDNYKKYFNEKQNLLLWNIALLMSSDSDHRKALEQKENISTEDAEKKYSSAKFDPNTKIRENEYKAAQEIFEMLQNYINNNSAGDIERMKIVGMTVLNVFLTIDSLIDSATDGFKENAESILFYAEALTYYLDETITCNGYTVSLNLSDENRLDWRNKLKTLYSSLQKLDPNFVAPPLPRVEAINPFSNSGSSGGSSSGGCYVATAVYGSYDCPEVWTLRRYRDKDLAKTWYGRAFIRMYYATSPTLVKLFGDKKWFKNMWKGKLDKKVKRLQEKGYEATPYEDKQW